MEAMVAFGPTNEIWFHGSARWILATNSTLNLNFEYKVMNMLGMNLDMKNKVPKEYRRKGFSNLSDVID